MTIVSIMKAPERVGRCLARPDVRRIGHVGHVCATDASVGRGVRRAAGALRVLALASEARMEGSMNPGRCGAEEDKTFGVKRASG